MPGRHYHISLEHKVHKHVTHSWCAILGCACHQSGGPEPCRTAARTLCLVHAWKRSTRHRDRNKVPGLSDTSSLTKEGHVADEADIFLLANGEAIAQAAGQETCITSVTQAN